jgi:hypothetical protein
VSAISAATLTCRVCGAEIRLDDSKVVHAAEIAAYVAAHRHPAGFAVALRVAAVAGEACPAHAKPARSA